MTKDKNITEVMFRKEKSGDFKDDITAVMPYDIADYKGNVTMYCHYGQHSAADYNIILAKTVPATKKEYAELKKELDNHYDYNFKIIKRRNYDKYLKEFRRTQKRT